MEISAGEGGGVKGVILPIKLLTRNSLKEVTI